jgi:hypothetical protein
VSRLDILSLSFVGIVLFDEIADEEFSVHTHDMSKLLDNLDMETGAREWFAIYRQHLSFRGIPPRYVPMVNCF